MNARTPAPPPVFVIPFRTEDVATDLFGTVTVSELSSRKLEALHALIPKDDDASPEDKSRFAYRLLCEAARGENGERFTLEVLDDLPTRAFTDVAKLVRVAVRLNGMDREAVEKA
ncbi:hypothetical protein [Paraburkholderia silvatlantica]|uniref:hypothetical protein n=1 Tax=Paraburkholderia silvatlantica TaxID=321895 RepID=UPI00375004C4